MQLRSALATALLAVLLLGCFFGTPPASSGPDVPVAVVRPGGRVDEDRDLRIRLSGDLVPVPRLAAAAACHNAVRWKRDVSLNLSVVVSSAELPIRVAELVADGEISDEAGDAVLETWLQGDPLEELLATSEEFAGVAELLDEQPSDAAAGRFVGYASSLTIWDQEFLVLDTDNIQGRWARSAEVFETIRPIVAGAGTLPVETATCERFFPTPDNSD